MFNVKISYNIDTDFIEEKALERRKRARAAFFNELIENGFIEELVEKEGIVTFKTTYGKTQEFLDKLPQLIYQFRVVDKRSKIMLEAMTTV